MTEIFTRMLSDEDESPDKCRERRRRRIEMRRLAAVSAAGSLPPMPNQSSGQNHAHTLPESSGDTKRIRTAEKSDLPSASSPSSGDDVEASSSSKSHEGRAREPVFGTMSVSGRLREMEDAISVRASLCEPEISRGQPVHYFAVFDGHGGPHVHFAHHLLRNYIFKIQK